MAGDSGDVSPRREHLSVVGCLLRLGPLDYLLYFIPVLLLLTCDDYFDDIVDGPHDCQTPENRYESACPTAETEVEFGEHPDQTELVEPTTVATWEDLPVGGEYTEADDSGTVWYKTVEGEYWYRNADDSWSVFDSDGS